MGDKYQEKQCLMDNNEQLDDLEFRLKGYKRRENTKFWFRTVGWLVLIVAIVGGVIALFEMTHRIDGIGQRLDNHISACVSDSVSTLQREDVYELVDKANQESLNTYISSQGTFLTVLAALITILVALIGIAVPLLTNKGLSDQLRKKISEQVNDQEKQIKKEIGEEVKMQEKELIERLNKETEEKIKEAKKQIDDKITEIGTDAKSKSEKMGAEMESAKRRIEKIERDVTGIIEDLRKRQENFDKNREIENKSPNEQVEEWRKMEEEDRADSDTYFNLGKYYFNKQDYDKANNYFGKAVRNRDNYAEVYPLWAESLEKQGQLLKAWEKIEKAIALNSNDQELKNKQKTLLERILTPASSLEETETIEIGGVKFDMKLVRKGVFTMGATPEQKDDAWGDEIPAHEVLLPNDYYIGETVVTQALWMAVMGGKNNPSKSKGDNRPVERVSWNDVTQIFIPELNRRTGRQFRLPTEAEWEYAARGGNKSKGYKYSGSDDIDEVAWYGANSNGVTHPVKGKMENELGLYDMSGNVFEWCQDWYGEYSGDSQFNPTGPENGQNRVCRGGCWYYNARLCRVSYRHNYDTDRLNDLFGFRLVLDASLPQEGKKKA